MGKNGELWDDSALIKAFDDAISKYKIMHGKEENLATPVDESNEAKRHMEADDNNIAALKNTTMTRETTNPSLIQEHHSDSFVVERYADKMYLNDSSNDLHVQDADKMSLNTQTAEDYNHLLNQYNELEKQRQKVLEQLYQLGYWNYQGYCSSVQEGISYASQEHEVPPAQASYPAVVCSCRSFVCPYSTAPCSSLAAFSSSAACVGKPCDTSSTIAHNGSSVSLEDRDVIKAARGAAERAVCSFKIEASGTSKLNTEKEGDKEVKTDGGEGAENRKSETDLTDVLNAWFSAGFYTGKYLAEQSSAKK